ncbi:hypothetical protein ACQPW3_27180 [Actinosynnema sp. CA-248983]
MPAPRRNNPPRSAAFPGLAIGVVGSAAFTAPPWLVLVVLAVVVGPVVAAIFSRRAEPWHRLVELIAQLGVRRRPPT